ncbi:MAG: helix-hairpin-helix domain-containing protein, partial [Planctomycetota bacterium]|nr:helix-hairpin-helix domain-containing protein [Planctomycetota bacterium]
MVAEQILQRLEAEFDSPPEQIRAVADLLAAGASPEFVALFRRDETGDPGEERVQAIAERLRFLSELEARKTLLLEQAATRGPDVEELCALLKDSVDQDLLDDVDHYLRPHEHKAEAQVERLGLGALVDRIHRHDLDGKTPQEVAAGFVRADEEGVADADQVLAQVVLALAERYGEDPSLRARIRGELARGLLTAEARAKPPKKDKSKTHKARVPDDFAAGIEEQPADAPTTEQAEAEADLADAADSAPADADAPEHATASEEAVAEPATETAEAPDQPPSAPFGDAGEEGSTGPEGPTADAPDAPATDAPATDAPATDAEAGGDVEATADGDAGADAEGSESSDPTSADVRPARGKRGKRGGKGTKSAGKGGPRVDQLLGIREPVRRIPAGQMLALRRAEREGLLQLKLVLQPGRELELFRERFSPDVDPESPLGRFLDLVYGHAYDTYVHRPCEQTVRHHIKEKADRETVRAFTRSLRSQLMAPVVEGQAVGALRVAGRTAWLAILAADGSTKTKLTLAIPEGAEARAELVRTLAEAIQTEKPAVLGLPHGRRETAARDLAREVIGALSETEPPLLAPVDETAAVVWATSPQARRRHAHSDTGMRTTLSLARRLRDPLFELMRVEPRGLGLGQNLTEVHQGMLKRQLDATLSSCLAVIGIDVNRADATLLGRAPGVSKDLAKAIVQDRVANGSFATLEDLKRVPGIDDATFVRVAGFLRVQGGTDPLDATGVPPENRPLVARIAERMGVEPGAVLGSDLRGVRIDDVRDEEFGFLRVRDTFDALRRGANDPRGSLEPVRNPGVQTFADLRLDQQVEGRITNMADFGAFIDLGVGQDGLLHISQIPGSRLRDPARILRVGEVVQVFVVHLDESGRKIGLSMHKPRHVAEGRPATL